MFRVLSLVHLGYWVLFIAWAAAGYKDEGRWTDRYSRLPQKPIMS